METICEIEVAGDTTAHGEVHLALWVRLEDFVSSNLGALRWRDRSDRLKKKGLGGCW